MPCHPSILTLTSMHKRKTLKVRWDFRRKFAFTTGVHPQKKNGCITSARHNNSHLPHPIPKNGLPLPQLPSSHSQPLNSHHFSPHPYPNGKSLPFLSSVRNRSPPDGFSSFF